jgi:hypothetical protein
VRIRSVRMEVDEMATTPDRGTSPPPDHVRLVYHYRDGHDFVTEAMLRAEALAYMPLLRAVRVDAEHYEASFGWIELRAG